MPFQLILLSHNEIYLLFCINIIIINSLRESLLEKKNTSVTLVKDRVICLLDNLREFFLYYVKRSKNIKRMLFFLNLVSLYFKSYNFFLKNNKISKNQRGDVPNKKCYYIFSGL